MLRKFVFLINRILFDQRYVIEGTYPSIHIKLASVDSNLIFN